MSTATPCRPISIDVWCSPRGSKASPWTYFIEGGPFIKIGSAISPLKRLKELQTGNPYTLRLLAVIADDERWLHWKFSHLRARGEWFRAECGFIVRKLSRWWFEHYGSSEVITTDTVSRDFGVSQRTAKAIVAPYLRGQSLTGGLWKLICDERCSVVSGMRLFEREA